MSVSETLTKRIMKIIKKNFWNIIFVAALLTAVFSCSKDENVTPDPEISSSNLSQPVQEIMMVNAITSTMRSQGIGGPAAVLSNPNPINGRSSMAPDSPLVLMWNLIYGQHFTDVDLSDCLKSDLTDRPRDHYTWVTDFGTGCVFEKDHFKGKIIEKVIPSDHNGFLVEVTYVNFGGKNWTINGTEIISGSWKANDSTGFSTTYTFVEDLEITHGDIQFQYQRTGQETVDELAWVVEENEETISYSSGTLYNKFVIEPLIFSFECARQAEVTTFVAGIELNQYKIVGGDDGVTREGSFLVNYGDGECDNLIFIEQDQVTDIFDLGQFIVDFITDLAIG